MLPSWRSRLFIAVSQERISLLMLKRGLKTTLIACHDEGISAVGKLPCWQRISDSLSQILAQPEWQKAEVNIVLSNRLVRYAVMPFSAQLKTYTEQEAFARHILIRTYGATANQWTLRIHRAKAGSPWLISAVDQELLEGGRRACAIHKLKLCSLTPYLMQVFNRYRKTIKNDPAWLVINEPGYSLFVLLSGGELVAINGVCHDGLSELPLLLDRENLASSLSEPCKSVYLYTAEPDSNILSAMPKIAYEFHILDIVAPDDFPSSADGLYAVAMSGVL